MVTDDVCGFCKLDATLNTEQMVEALIALGPLGNFIGGQKRVKFTANARRILHSVLRAAGVNGHAVHGDFRTCGIEVFILHLAKRAAVNGVRILRAKRLNIEVVRTLANLLIGGECHRDFAVGDALFNDDFKGGHNLCDTRLVIRTDKRCAVRNDKMLSRKGCKIGIIGDGHIDALLPVEKDVAALVFHDTGTDIFVGSLAGGIHMCDKANRVMLALCGGGQACINIAKLINAGIGKTHCKQLLAQLLRQDKLLCRGGCGAGGFIRHCGVCRIGQKSFICSHFYQFLPAADGGIRFSIINISTNA